MPAKEQAEMLKALVGVDLSPLDKARQAAYEERTIVQREAKSPEGALAGMPVVADVPDTEISVAELSAKHSAITQQNSANERIRNNAKEYDRFLAEATEALEKAKKNFETTVKLHAEAQAKVKEAVDADPSAIIAQIKNAEQTNAEVRENAKRSETAKRLEAKKAEADALTKRLDDIDGDKAAILSNAKFPISGLSFQDNGVTLNGLPFAQASQAEKIRASLAIGIAMNPGMRVLLVRDGSLLDSDSMAIIKEMADKADAQVFIEKVSDDGKGCAIVIEDGMVLAPF
jgi:hypothetical protein